MSEANIGQEITNAAIKFAAKEIQLEEFLGVVALTIADLDARLAETRRKLDRLERRLHGDFDE